VLWVTSRPIMNRVPSHESAIRQGWGGRPVRQERAQGMLVAALGMLARESGSTSGRSQLIRQVPLRRRGRCERGSL
jgi:hypothetical protein